MISHAPNLTLKSRHLSTKKSRYTGVNLNYHNLEILKVLQFQFAISMSYVCIALIYLVKQDYFI